MAQPRWPRCSATSSSKAWPIWRAGCTRCGGLAGAVGASALAAVAGRQELALREGGGTAAVRARGGAAPARRQPGRVGHLWVASATPAPVAAEPINPLDALRQLRPLLVDRNMRSVAVCEQLAAAHADSLGAELAQLSDGRHPAGFRQGPEGVRPVAGQDSTPAEPANGATARNRLAQSPFLSKDRGWAAYNENHSHQTARLSSTPTCPSRCPPASPPPLPGRR